MVQWEQCELKRFLFVDSGQPFGIDHYKYNPLGGSEASVLMLAKAIAESGNSAVILNNSTQKQESINLLIDNIKLFPQYTEICDNIILNRIINQDIINISNHFNKPIYYYCHDAYDQNIIHWLGKKNSNFLEHISKFLCVSEWQRDTFFKYFNIINPKYKNKFEVIGNSLDVSLYSGYTDRDLNKLIFASIPYKGLEFLDNIINDLVLKTKNKDLKLHVFSNMSLYGKNGNVEESNTNYNQIYSKLSQNPNIVLRDLVSMKELAYEFATSNLYIHPNLYHETFGMVFIQAQAAGCIPVTTNSGAVRETIENKDNIIPETTIYNQNTYDLFIDKIIENLNKSDEQQYNHRSKAKAFAKQFSSLNIAKKVLNLTNQKDIN